MTHYADSTPCFDEIPEDNPEDELEPWVDYITRATHHADGLLAASGITLWILRQSQIYWRQARTTAKHHEERWTEPVSNWNPAISTEQQGYLKHGRPAKRWEDDHNIHLQPNRANRNDNDLTSDMTWLTTAEDNSKWDAMESDFVSNRLKQPTRPPTLSPRLRQPNHQHTTKQQVRLRLTTTTKTTTNKATTIRWSSSHNKSATELPLHRTRSHTSNQVFS